MLYRPTTVEITREMLYYENEDEAYEAKAFADDSWPIVSNVMTDGTLFYFYIEYHTQETE